MNSPADDPAPDGNVVRFPQSRVAPAGSDRPAKQLGFGRLATVIGAPQRQTTGHWCSRCQGIWYGYLLEVDCPACGNRHG